MCFLHAYSVIACREYSGRGHPRHSVASKISSAARGFPPTIPFSRAPPGHRPTGGVGGRCLVPATVAGIKLTYCASVRQQERSYFRQLSFCIGFQGCWCVSLHAYKSPSLLSKPVSPEVVKVQEGYSYLRFYELLGYVAKKKSSFVWGLSFVWRSGRDSNSRPHAWQACILTKLNYRTVCILNCERTLFVSQMRLQKYDFFWNLQIFFLFFFLIKKLFAENQMIAEMKKCFVLVKSFLKMRNDDLEKNNFRCFFTPSNHFFGWLFV